MSDPTKGGTDLKQQEWEYVRECSRYGGAAGYAIEMEGKKRAQPGIYCYSSLDEMFATLRSGRGKEEDKPSPKPLNPIVLHQKLAPWTKMETSSRKRLWTVLTLADGTAQIVWWVGLDDAYDDTKNPPSVATATGFARFDLNG